MKVRMTVERDGTPLFSTIFEVTNGDISVAAPAPLNEFRRQYPDLRPAAFGRALTCEKPRSFKAR